MFSGAHKNLYIVTAERAVAEYIMRYPRELSRARSFVALERKTRFCNFPQELRPSLRHEQVDGVGWVLRFAAARFTVRMESRTGLVVKCSGVSRFMIIARGNIVVYSLTKTRLSVGY